MEKNLATARLTVPRPEWERSRLVSRIVHLGCGAFHRAHQALFTHHLLACSDSDWGICEVNIRPGNGARLIESLNAQNLLYTVAEQGTAGTTLQVIGSIKEALHPEFDGIEGILAAMARPETAIVSLTITEKGYCSLPASGALDLNHPSIQHDLRCPSQPESVIGYIVEALNRRREQGIAGFTVLSCDNVRENGLVAKAAVLGLAQARDPMLAQWIEQHVTFPCTMVDRIVPAATPESLALIAKQLGVFDPCAIACESFRQWVIEDNFVQGRPDWNRVGAQFVADVTPFEIMKLRMLNGSHTFLAYLGYLAGYETIADTMGSQAYRHAVKRLMLQEQAVTLSLPQGTSLNDYAESLISRFANTSLKHRTWQIAMDGSQKLPQRLLDPVRQHLATGDDFSHLALGIAGWMRYVSGLDEQGERIEVIDPLVEQYQDIHRRELTAEGRCLALLSIHSIFGDDLPKSSIFVSAVMKAYISLLQQGARRTVEALENEGVGHV